jgi:hypothetical protein
MFWLAEFLTQKFSATWAVSVYFAYQRTWKPFNPILGETYEMVNHQGITFLAEQVSGMKLSLPKGLVQIFFLNGKQQGRPLLWYFIYNIKRGLVQILCQPMLLCHLLLLVVSYTIIFSGKSSSSNGCCAL